MKATANESSKPEAQAKWLRKQNVPELPDLRFPQPLRHFFECRGACVCMCWCVCMCVCVCWCMCVCFCAHAISHCRMVHAGQHLFTGGSFVGNFLAPIGLSHVYVTGEKTNGEKMLIPSVSCHSNLQGASSPGVGLVASMSHSALWDSSTAVLLKACRWSTSVRTIQITVTVLVNQAGRFQTGSGLRQSSKRSQLTGSMRSRTCGDTFRAVR